METTTLEKANDIQEKIRKLEEVIKKLKYIQEQDKGEVRYVKTSNEDVYVAPYFQEHLEINRRCSKFFVTMYLMELEQECKRLQEEFKNI